jgi:chitinase
MSRRLPVMVVALVAVVAALSMTGSSSASFVSSSSSTGTVSAAADWTPPTVAVTQPDAILKGAVTVVATASDATSGVASVTIERAAAGTSAWTTICSKQAAPYSCSWATTAVADGAYDLRATAVDKAGNSTTSTTVRVTVANTLAVTLARPGDFLRGSASTTTTISNAGSVKPSSVRVEYAPAGTTSWATACTSTTAPYTCSVATAGIPNGTYDLRAVAVVGTITVTSPLVSGVVVDNLAPTVTMTDPGTTVRGIKTFAASPTDTHSGIAEVTLQAISGTKTVDLCTVTASPYSCSYDTTKLANGSYTFRAVATDRAGNSTVSAPTALRTVSNVATTVTLAAPKPAVSGTVNLTGTAASNSISSIKVQRSVAGANTWTTICTPTATSFSCSFATKGLEDGTYDLRAVVTDADGRTATSAIVSTLVDNTPGKGVDIQTTDGGTAGRVDAGDTIVYTFSEQMDLSSIYAGWSGSATSGTAKVKGGFFVSDSFEISSPSNIRLGSVELNADFALWLVDASASMSISAELDDLGRTVVTVKILSTPGTGLRVTDPATMVWTPSSSITDLAGNAIGSGDVIESGDQDVDF